VDLAAFRTYLAERSDQVDDALLAFLRRGPAVDNLTDGAIYALGLDVDDRTKRGKRLRPVLCLLACESLGGDPEKAMPFAVATELLHNFLLVHDDIEDEDRVRRDRPAVWVRYGMAHGINIGDYLHAKTYEAVLESAHRGVDEATLLRLLRLVATTVVRTGEGQAMDIGARARRDLTLDDYVAMVTEKTGHYLAAPFQGGAMVAGADDAVLDALAAFGKAVGPVFQIADDVIDLTEGKGRGERGSDIREGKRSWLAVYTAGVCTEAERGRLYDILDTPREATTAEDVAWVVDLFARYDAVSAAREAGDALLARGRAALEGVPPRLRENLDIASRFMLERRR
jgi:geranylgeranyl pyrophosphate synthase